MLPRYQRWRRNPDLPGRNRSTGEESLHFLSFLEHADAITPAQRELIIDRLMALDAQEVIEPTKLTALIVLWNQQVTSMHC